MSMKSPYHRQLTTACWPTTIFDSLEKHDCVGCGNKSVVYKVSPTIVVKKARQNSDLTKVVDTGWRVLVVIRGVVELGLAKLTRHVPSLTLLRGRGSGELWLLSRLFTYILPRCLIKTSKSMALHEALGDRRLEIFFIS